MISNLSPVQTLTRRGIMADAILTKIPGTNGKNAPASATQTANYTSNYRRPDIVSNVAAEIVFPAFNFVLPALIELALGPNNQELTLRIEIEPEVALVWQNNITTTHQGTGSRIESNIGLEVSSPWPRAHFIAATLEALLLMDETACLRAPGLPPNCNIHFSGSLRRVSECLQQRQLAYRLLVIETAFGRKFPLPSGFSAPERTDLEFIFHAVTERSFVWQFMQEPFDFPANEMGRELLGKIDGTFPFLIEIGCLQQPLLGQPLNLGAVKITVQNTALAHPTDVARELKQLDGHVFQAVITSLSGAATYEFLAAPHLPVSPWDDRLAQLIGLEDQLDDQFFAAGNRLAASSIDEETALEQERLLEPLTFDFSDTDNAIAT